MPTLIEQVKSKLFIASSRPSMNALDGSYPSLLRGRSLDFEDLHRYEYGDDIRDIDWRATARLGALLVKRSRAQRAHTVLFVVDTGRGMAALARDERPKRELSILATGVLGFLTLRHGDQFALVHGNAGGVQRTQARRSEGALESALRTIQHDSGPHAPASDREALLDYVVRTIARRRIVVIVTDGAPVTLDTERLLKRLQVQHDVLWVTVADADPVAALSRASGERSDVDTGWRIPGFVHGDDEVRGELLARRNAESRERAALMDRLSITHVELESQNTAVQDLLRALDRRSRVRR